MAKITSSRSPTERPTGGSSVGFLVRMISACYMDLPIPLQRQVTANPIIASNNRKLKVTPRMAMNFSALVRSICMAGSLLLQAHLRAIPTTHLVRGSSSKKIWSAAYEGGRRGSYDWRVRERRWGNLLRQLSSASRSGRGGGVCRCQL